MPRHKLTLSTRARSALGILLIAIATASCAGAYAEAVARGDKFAEAGLWDKAAVEYEAAVRLDPSDPEAQIKLKDVKRRQSGERLSTGRALLARGEIEKALVSLQDAARLDPESADAQRALAEANTKALEKAEELLEADNGRKALELTTLVLKDSPNDPRAKSVDGKVRDALAEQAYTRADAFLARGKLGNALMEFAACVTYRPGFKDAKLRIGQVKLALERELMFYVVLEKFTEGAGGNLSTNLTADLLAQSFDPKLPLRVVDRLPAAVGATAAIAGSPPAVTPTSAGKAAAPGIAAEATTDPQTRGAYVGPRIAAAVRGVRLSGKFDGYRFSQTKNQVGRSCDYVCGKDRAPNPEYRSAEEAVARAEQDHSRAESDVASAQKEFDRAQQQSTDERNRKQKEVTEKEIEADRARAELDKCEAKKKPTDSSPCSSERSRLESRQSALNSARSSLASYQGSLDSVKSRLDSARDRATRAREAKDSATARMRSTPREIEKDRYCPHNYNVDVHHLEAKVTVALSAEQLEEKTKLLENQPFEYKVAQDDESREAHPGRCPQVAVADPLTLPSEKEVKQRLVTQAIAGVREKVMSTYEGYRQRFLADARREEASGLPDNAVESYVRYLLTGSKGLDPKDQKQIGEFLAKTRGFGKLDLLGGL